LGELHVALTQMELARTYFERALRIDELVYGPNHIAVFNRLNQLARVLKETGDYDGARRCVHRASDILAAAKAPSASAAGAPASPADSGAGVLTQPQPMKPQPIDELTPVEVPKDPEPSLADLEPLADTPPGFLKEGGDIDDLPKLKADEGEKA
jgi:hypothetical protein